MGLFSVTIDLDEVACYHAIHGLDEPAEEIKTTIYRRALPRVARFVGELGIPATFFVVGRDLLACAEAISILGDLSNRGHEIGNHTMNHHYDFAARSSLEQQAEIDEAAEVIGREIGIRPRGFRAPGYNVNLSIIELLRDRHYLYDSSVFPCPFYQSVKGLAVQLKAWRGTPSASVLLDPRMAEAPTRPYRIGEEGVWESGNGLCELPITVVTRAKIPFIGTSLALLRTPIASLLARRASRLPFVNLELHGIDFVDADGDGLSHLKKYQLELRIPLVKRRATLERVIEVLKAAGQEAVTLSDAAERVFV